VSDYTVKLKPTAAAQKVKSGQRRSYRNWWHPHLMPMIMRAVISQDGYLPAVTHLKLHHPVLFAGLGESFVRGMYQPGSLKNISGQI
jgi:hypothetical protein